MNAQQLQTLAGFENMNLDSFYYDSYNAWIIDHSAVLLMIVNNQIEDMNNVAWNEPQAAFERWLAQRIITYLSQRRVTNAKDGLFVSEFSRFMSKQLNFVPVTVTNISFKEGLTNV